MRTKALLLTAAVIAAGIGASQAQVYSVNAVGYVNLTLRPGYNLIGNPLNGTNNNINTLIPTMPADSQVLRWSGAAQSFTSIDTYFDVGDPAQNGWYNANFERSTTVINPGEGFFVRNAGAAVTVTFVGEVPQGNLTNTVFHGYGFYSSIVPQSAGLQAAMGFPAAGDMIYTRWSATNQAYYGSVTYFDVGDPAQNGWYDGNFNPAEPVPAVGEGFLIYNPSATRGWVRSFTVN